MKKYLLDYIDYCEKKEKVSKEDMEELKTKILFFQHERLIHLLVTLFYQIFTLTFLALGMISYFFLIIFTILIVFDICYILYYFFLENHVQYLYKIYDNWKKKVK